MHVSRPFVGRGAELDLLLERLTAAGAGRGGVLLVSGPAGIGKTRLVEEALGRHGGAAVGRGVCTDDRGAPPLWPWSRALTALGRAVGDPGLTAALRPGDDPAGLAAEPAAVAAARFRALTAATDAVLQAASGRPVVLVLEDLHWADAESLELLRRIAAESGAASLLVLGTHRDALPDEVAAAVADVRRAPAAGTVPLPPLTPAEVGQYLGTADGGEVHRRTGGLPLLVAAGSDSADLGVVVAGMLARLLPAERAVVEVLALLGGGSEPGTLAEVAGQDPVPVAAALRAGRRAGLLGSGTEFVHALLRDGVRDQVAPGTARDRHRRAAEVVAARLPAEPELAGEVAAHLRAAGDAAGSARYSVLAAEHAGRVLALDDAVRHLRDAVACLRTAGAGDADSAELLIALATAEFQAGRLPDSLARCEQAAAAAARAGRPDLLAEAALVVRGVTYPEVADVVRRLAERALAADPPTGTQARLLAQVATMAAEQGRPVEAQRQAAEALRLAEQDGDPAAVLDAARARELTLLSGHDSAERLRLGRLALGRATELGQPLAAALGASWMLRAGYQLARLDVVDEAFGSLERVAVRSGQPLPHWHLLRANAARATMEGRFELARQCNRQATEVAEAIGDPTALGLSNAYGAHLARLRGDPAELPPGFWPALASFPTMPLIRASEANLLLMHGRRDEAYGIWEELRAALGAMVPDFRWGGAVLEFAELAVAFRDGPTAEVLLEGLAEYRDCPGAVGVSTVYFSGSPLREIGLLAATAGRPDEAVGLLRRAVAANLAVRGRPMVAVCRLELAELLHRQGEPDEAVELVRQAAGELRRLDMPGPLARADRLMAELAAARRHADPLSARERQVADLVVRALSNREIAAELVLSERTVESHVRSILNKLGAANRTELIARGR